MIQMTKRMLAAFACAFALGTAADEFPSRPITIVVAYQPGGANDIMARAVAKQLSAAVGQPVLVENKPGAGGNLGATYVARSAPNGYTILNAPISLLSINQWLYKDLQYNAERDFAPVTEIGSVPNMLIVSNTLPVSNVKELIAYAKANPGKLNFASMGTGTTGHLSGELFKMMAGVQMTHVPYKGSGPALADLLGGHVQLMFDNLPTALPLAREGKVKGIAVTSRTRHPLAPDVPTLDELGLSGFEASPWFGFVVPSGTPKPIVERLHAELVKALRDPEVAQSLGKVGLSIVASSPAEFAAFISSESQRWRQVVERSGAKQD
jgi:tripartite-type tricarboxylate transporter receptor subunit TctC